METNPAGDTRTRNIGLDVARAFAALLVVMGHWLGGLWWISCVTTPGSVLLLGACAVHLFFALSGFLIGSILFRIAEAPSFHTWTRFMVRRWTRTLPLYAVVLCVLCAVSPEFRVVALRFLTLTQSFFGGIPAGGEMLGTAWSLAVEEVFYLAFSIAFLGCATVFGRRSEWPVIIAFIVIPAAARCLFSWDDAYHAVIPNLDGIAYGVALAKLQRNGSALFRIRGSAIVSGLALLVSAWIPYAAESADLGLRWRAETLPLSTLGWCLILVAALRIRSLPHTLEKLVGIIASHSYGLYLIHLPILLMLNGLVAQGQMSFVMATLAFFATTAFFSALGRRWIELPAMSAISSAKRTNILTP